jgi:hypothetical protein
MSRKPRIGFRGIGRAGGLDAHLPDKDVNA